MGGRQCKQALSTAKETCAVDWQTLIDVVHSGNYVHFVDGKMVLEADYNDKQYELHITSSTADMLISNAKHAVEIREKGGATVRTVPSAAFVFDGPSVLSKVGTVDAFLWTYNEQESKLHTPDNAKVLVKHHVTSHKKLNLQELKETHPEHLWTIKVSSTLMSLRSDGPADTTTQKEVEQLQKVIWDLDRAENEQDSLESWKYQDALNLDIDDARISHGHIIPLYKKLISVLDEHINNSDMSHKERWKVRKASVIVKMNNREHTMANMNIADAKERVGEAPSFDTNGAAVDGTGLMEEVRLLNVAYTTAQNTLNTSTHVLGSTNHTAEKLAEANALSLLNSKKAELAKAVSDLSQYSADLKKFTFERLCVALAFEHATLMKKRVEYDRLKAVGENDLAEVLLKELGPGANNLTVSINSVIADYGTNFDTTAEKSLVSEIYNEFNFKHTNTYQLDIQGIKGL